jgi:hypothetical protein
MMLGSIAVCHLRESTMSTNIRPGVAVGADERGRGAGGSGSPVR